MPFAIVKPINTVEAFRVEFERLDRTKFSYYAQEAMFEHLCELAESTGEPVELDVISLCGEYTEWTRDEAIAEIGASDATDDDIVDALAEMFGTALKFEHREWNHDRDALDVSTRFLTLN